MAGNICEVLPKLRRIRGNVIRAANKRLQRTRHERASLRGCVGEPLKPSVRQLSVNEPTE